MMKTIGEKRIILLLGIAGTLGVLMNGCIKDNSAEKAAQEQNEIDTYLADHNISKDTKTADGIYYVEETAGTGDSIKFGDYMVINFTGRNINGSLIETNDSTTAAAAGKYNQYYVYHPIKLKFGYSLPGINVGISYMRAGGKATLIIPSSMANNDYNPLVYEIDLLRVIKDPVADARNELNNYLSELDSTKYQIDGHKVMPSDSLDSGIYYIVNDSIGTNTDSIASGDSVYVAYTGYFTDGKSFTKVTADNPLGFVYGDTKFIPGFDEAIGYMHTGTKVRVVIPYYDGYGTEGVNNPTYNFLLIPAYSTLIYDIELVKHKKNS